mgnify:CR=1 FL=1
MNLINNCLTAKEYLQHRYDVSKNQMQLSDEPFVQSWKEAKGKDAIEFMDSALRLPAKNFTWENIDAIKISFAQTMGGRLPVIDTASHNDFRQMDALVNGKSQVRDLPLTVNAFTIQARAEEIYHHRVIILNRAPYSNIGAEKLGLENEDWLNRSQKLRLRHECAHYETLRLFGGMQNHALDEIIADTLGQIAAFGKFYADKQRLFFGLEKGKGTCSGRLSFYTKKVSPEDREKIYRAVDAALPVIEEKANALLEKNADEYDILAELAGKSVAELLEKY